MANPSLVLFGITGDLAQHKLVPALWSGFRHGRFADIDIWGVGRKPWGDAGLRQKAREACQPRPDQEAEFAAFEKKLRFFRVDVDAKKEFDGFCAQLEKRGDLLFMLATAPELFPKISKRLGRLKNAGFRRAMIEKPFGEDLASAKRLHHLLQKHFGDQVYPIDHYLGKSTVRNIMVLRFSNPVFEPAWNRRFIKDVQIIQSEEGGVGHRTAFYDQTGALRDMVQSHLLQMLARVAMEPPKKWEPGEVAKQKARVLQKLRPAPGVVFGQYDGYAQEVGKTSSTETFVALKAFIDTPRWKGV
ncbi:MAG: glucose-6-phosphate dehydrogenase, partial [Candidatus Micrarchaeota archaeon]|nr:glucose-6-phosphate dehydrogenase [Candidatus Micrarchaeota archaeon]